MLAQIAPQIPAFSVVLLVVCGTLIGVALTSWRAGDSTDLEHKVRSLREENNDLQAMLRQQQEVHRQQEEHQRILAQQSTSLRELAAVTADVRCGEAEIERLQEELATARQQQQHLAEERDLAVAALEEAGATYLELQRDVDSHRRAIESIERQRGQMQIELQTMQQQAIEWREQGRGRQELQARYDAVRQELAESHRQEAILRAQLSEALDAQRRWQLELQAEHAAAAADRERLEQLERQRMSGEQQSDRLRADRESMLESLRGAQAQNRALTQQLGDQERLIRELRDELGTLQALWEQRSVVATSSTSSPPADGDIAELQGARVAELERQVEELREQLRMAQVQAHELIQRQPTESAPGATEATVRQLQQQVHQQTRAITHLERDREELLARIQRQNQLLEDRAA